MTPIFLNDALHNQNQKDGTPSFCELVQSERSQT